MKFFKNEGKWLKGALHLHTTGSDGLKTPEELAQIYANNGYKFIAFTDHKVVTGLGKAPGGLIIIKGTEIGHGLYHAVGIGMTEAVGNPVNDKKYILKIMEKAKFYFLCHPYWSDLNLEDVKELKGLGVLEVFNTACEISIARGYSEYLWDSVLSAGIRMNAIAADDSHQRLKDYCKAWVFVKAATPDENGILEALKNGYYYSSNGPEIRDAVVDEEGISVVTSRVKQIRFIAKSWLGEVFESEKGLTKARYEFSGKEMYVRVECVDFEGRKAWSNPYYVD